MASSPRPATRTLPAEALPNACSRYNGPVYDAAPEPRDAWTGARLRHSIMGSFSPLISSDQRVWRAYFPSGVRRWEQACSVSDKSGLADTGSGNIGK